MTGGLHVGDDIPVYNSGLNQDVILGDVCCTSVVLGTGADEGVSGWLGSGVDEVVQLVKTNGRETIRTTKNIIFV